MGSGAPFSKECHQEQELHTCPELKGPKREGEREREIGGKEENDLKNKENPWSCYQDINILGGLGFK